MKIFRIRNTAKTIFTGKKINTTKTRFLILVSIALVAISSTVAFSTISTADSISDLLFGSASVSDTLMNASAQEDSKKDDKTSRLRQLAPNSLIGDLAKARSGHTATRLADGRVLILGGTSNGVAVASTEIYDAATGTFSAGATMNAARSASTATVLANGRILIADGDADGSAEIYDATANTFTSISTMTTSRSGHSAALMNDGRVLIVGGSGADGEELYSAEVFNPTDSTFSATGNQMAHDRKNALLRVLPDGKVQIIGGNEDLSMEVYDPNIDTIGAHGHLIPTDDEHTFLLQSDILAAQTRAAMFHNGQDDVMLDRSNFTVTELGNQALVAGGRNTNGNALRSLTVLDSSDATVSTDKLDYSPGQTAIITGTGWQANETVEIFLHEDPHTTAERRVTATADANGNFTANYLVEQHDFGITFIAGVKGQSSGRTAQTTFTDALIFSAAITPTTANVSSTISYSITVTNNSSASEVLGSGRIQIPIGYTAVSSITYTTSPSGKTWNPRVGTGSNSDKILYDAAADILNPGNSITITFTATAPATASSKEWTTVAFTGRNFSTGPYLAPATQPTVTVNNVAAATTLIVSPASGTYGGTVNLTATLTQTSGGAGVDGKTISFTLNGKKKMHTLKSQLITDQNGEIIQSGRRL